MKSLFIIKDFGKLKYFLGIEVINTNSGVCLTQRKYCLELLYEFGLLGCKPVKVPLDSYSKIDKNGIDSSDSLLTNIIGFQKLIGKLIYLTVTRLDISYTVQTLSQFMHSPRKSHLEIAIRLLRYLKMNPRKGVSIVKSNSYSITGFVDADWAKCLSSIKYVTEYCIFFIVL